MGGDAQQRGHARTGQGFQSTPPGWEATTAQRRHMQRHPISIHASRMGGDHRRCDSRVESGDISIHASRMGGDACEPGEVATEIISIHASRMGGDSLSFAGSSPQSKFQSTPPGWEATHQHGQPDDRGDISIHASRMGGDRNSFGIFTHAVDFNPRLPDGRRPEPMACGSADTTFQSTPPGWEATYLRSIMSQKILISIHASRMGGDSLDRTTVPVFHVFQSTPPGWEATDWPLTPPKVITNFNPRLPDGRRQHSANWTRGLKIFQSTPPGWEATRHLWTGVCRSAISIHASRMGGDYCFAEIARFREISIHASRMGGDFCRA